MRQASPAGTACVRGHTCRQALTVAWRRPLRRPPSRQPQRLHQRLRLSLPYRRLLQLPSRLPPPLSWPSSQPCQQHASSRTLGARDVQAGSPNLHWAARGCAPPVTRRSWRRPGLLWLSSTCRRPRQQLASSSSRQGLQLPAVRACLRQASCAGTLRTSPCSRGRPRLQGLQPASTQQLQGRGTWPGETPVWTHALSAGQQQKAPVGSLVLCSRSHSRSRWQSSVYWPTQDSSPRGFRHSQRSRRSPRQLQPPRLHSPSQALRQPPQQLHLRSRQQSTQPRAGARPAQPQPQALQEQASVLPAQRSQQLPSTASAIQAGGKPAALLPKQCAAGASRGPSLPPLRQEKHQHMTQTKPWSLAGLKVDVQSVAALHAAVDAQLAAAALVKRPPQARPSLVHLGLAARAAHPHLARTHVRLARASGGAALQS